MKVYYTDHFAVDVPLTLPFRHRIDGAGAIAGVGQIGETKALPVTLLAQYHFDDPKARLRPYVGAGPTYAWFFKERSTLVLTGLTGGSPANPTTLRIDSKLVPTVQLGLAVRVDAHWSIDAALTNTWLKTTTHLSTGQSLDIRLDPTSATLAVGYQF